MISRLPVVGLSALMVFVCGGGGGVCVWCVFFFNDTATTEIYTLSLHDALPISHIMSV